MRPWAQHSGVFWVQASTANHAAKRYPERYVAGLSPADSNQWGSETVGTGDRSSRAAAVVLAARVSAGAGPLPRYTCLSEQKPALIVSSYGTSWALRAWRITCSLALSPPRLSQPLSCLPPHPHPAGKVAQPHGHHCAARLFHPFVTATWANIWAGCLPAWVQFHAF